MLCEQYLKLVTSDELAFFTILLTCGSHFFGESGTSDTLRRTRRRVVVRRLSSRTSPE